MQACKLLPSGVVRLGAIFTFGTESTMSEPAGHFTVAYVMRPPTRAVPDRTPEQIRFGGQRLPNLPGGLFLPHFFPVVGTPLSLSSLDHSSDRILGLKWCFYSCYTGSKQAAPGV